VGFTFEIFARKNSHITGDYDDHACDSNLQVSDSLVATCTWTLKKYHYHTSNSRECMRVNGEALQLHAVHKKTTIFYYKSHENPYQALQVTHDASERAKVRMIKSLSM